MNDRRPPGRVGRAALIRLLAPTLGMEKSHELVSATAKQLGFPDPNSFSQEQTSALLATLGRVDGIVGVVARFALGRVSTLLEETEEEPQAVTGMFSRTEPRREAQTGSNAALPTVSSTELVDLFAATMGKEKAAEVVRVAAIKLALGTGPWVRPQALTLLDHLAAEDGIVGVVARFSKARVLLKLAK